MLNNMKIENIKPKTFHQLMTKYMENLKKNSIANDLPYHTK